jgi:hypothetical protein
MKESSAVAGERFGSFVFHGCKRGWPEMCEVKAPEL